MGPLHPPRAAAERIQAIGAYRGEEEKVSLRTSPNSKISRGQECSDEMMKIEYHSINPRLEHSWVYPEPLKIVKYK